MRIYFLGMPFFMLYNYGAAILRAVGDTKRPLIFLVISGIDQCSAESDPRDRVSYGCGGRSHCYCDFPVNFLHSGTQMSVYDRTASYQLRFWTD